MLIDGLDNDDESTGSSRTELSPEIVQEFQVVNNGLSAESVVELQVVPSMSSLGPEQISSAAMPSSLPGQRIQCQEPFETETEKPSFRRFRAGLALGGPIVKGKTFYYAAAEQEHNGGQIGSDIDPGVASTINAFLATGAFLGLSARQITTARELV